MNFKDWLITEEIWQNGTATVYHRTKQENIQSILSNNWIVGEGQAYGAGLYTTFALKSQFTYHMDQYGDTLLKFKVKDLNKYVICSTDVARQILGKQYKISDQLKNLNLSDLYTEEQIEDFDKMMSEEEYEVYSSKIARTMFLANRNLQKRAKGIIYYGQGDGYCLVKYEPIEDGTITLLGYAKIGTNETGKIDALLSNCEKDQEGKCKNPWTTSTDHLKIKTLHGLPAEKKQNYASIKNTYNAYNDLEKAISEPNTNSLKVKIYFARNKELINGLTDEDVLKLLISANKRDEIVKLIIQYKKYLTDSNVEQLLTFTKNPDEIAKLIIQNKRDLTDSNVFNLLYYATDKYEIAKLLGQENINKLTDDDVGFLIDNAKNQDEMAKLIIQYKKDLTDNNIERLLSEAKNPDEIAKLIIQNKKDLSNMGVYYLLYYATNKDEIAQLLGSENIKKLNYEEVYHLLYYATNKDEIAKILGSENIKKLNDGTVNMLIQDSQNPDEMRSIFQKYGRI